MGPQPQSRQGWLGTRVWEPTDPERICHHPCIIVLTHPLPFYFLTEDSQLTYTTAVFGVVSSSNSQEDFITSSALQTHIHDILVSFDICVGVILTRTRPTDGGTFGLCHD